MHTNTIKIVIIMIAMLVTQVRSAYAQPLQKSSLLLSKSLVHNPNVNVNNQVKPHNAPLKISQCSILQTNDNALDLNDVLRHALCTNPALAQALQVIAEKNADVDLANVALYPRVSANTEFATDRIPSSNSGAGALSKSATGSINLSWLLFDFGSRDANVLQARHTLSAALNMQENAILTTLTNTLKIYTEALTAFGKLNALSKSEAIAIQSFNIAQARYEAKIGSLSEKLQAGTALAQASLDKSKANGSWITSRGMLAVAIGINVRTPLSLASADEAFPAINSDTLVDFLIDEAESNHPRIRSASAEIDALKARLSAIKSEYKGTLSLSSNAAVTASFDKNASLQNNLNISLQANIPLFGGREKTARESQIDAQIANKQTQIELIRNELSNDIWGNATEIITESNNLAATDKLLNSANQNYTISVGRYKAGVGSILDLLLAQSILANAQLQLQETKIAIVKAQIRLAMATGRFNKVIYSSENAL